MCNFFNFVAPQFETVNAVPTNGNIKISWTLRHTGGLDINLNIFCQIEGEGSRSRLTDILSCESNECINENQMGSVALGPVNAGETYYCRVTVVNNNGSDNRDFSNIIVNEGKYRKLLV